MWKICTYNKSSTITILNGSGSFSNYFFNGLTFFDFSVEVGL